MIPLWHPQYLHAQNKIRALNEPLGLLRPVDEARLVLRKDFLARLASAQQERLLTILGRVTLGNAAVTAMDKFVHVDKLSYRDAARKWIRANQDRVDSWFDDGHADVVARTKQVEQYALPGETILSDEHSYVIPVRAPSAAGAYSPFSVSTTSPRVIHTSFQLPFELDGSLKHRLAYVGPIRPSSHPTLAVNGVQTVSEAEGLAAVRLCALNLLAQLRDAADGDLSRVQLLRLEGYISTADADGHFVNVPRVSLHDLSPGRLPQLTVCAAHRFSMLPHVLFAMHSDPFKAITRGQRSRSPVIRSMSLRCWALLRSCGGEPTFHL